MDTSQSNPKAPFTRLNFPAVVWRTEYWVSFMAYLLIPLSIYSDLAELPWVKTYRIHSTAVILILPFVPPFLAWLYKTVSILVKRAHLFPLLFDEFSHLQQEKQEIEQRYFNSLIDKQGLELSYATYQKDKYVVAIRKSKIAKWQKGNFIEVLDIQDNAPMGSFELTIITQDHYIAEHRSIIHPIWAGEIHAKQTVTALPYLRAYNTSQGAKNGKSE